jgi:hypothetical protein
MRPLLACSLLLVALAGCSAVPIDGMTDDGTPTPEATAPYEDLDGETVIETHRDRLREAGNATRHVESIQVVEATVTRDHGRNHTAYLDFTAKPPVRHVVYGDGQEMWVGPERNVSKGPDGRYSLYSGLGVFSDGIATSVVDLFDYEGPERVERDGRVAYRYRAEDVEALSAGASEAIAESGNVTVESASARLLIRADGVVVEAHHEMVFVQDGTRVTSNRTVRYTDVGSTAVTRPEWYDDAIEELGPFAGETTTVTLESDRLDATLSVTGAAEDVSEKYGAWTELRYSENARLLEDSPPMNAARASCIPWVRLPESYDDAELTVGYEEQYVPAGEERNLTLYRYDRDLQTVVAVDGATVEVGADRVRGAVDENGMYVVLHTPTWVEAFGSRELPDSATGVPGCE